MRCGAVVLTTGTFLRGTIHIGHERVHAGRHGDAPALELATSIERLGLQMGRLKTGTPPRLHRHGIAWDEVEGQRSDDDAEPMSWMTASANERLVECGLTYTTPETHDLVRENVHRTALYGGRIHGAGPRYCPSLEDKVVRFADRDRHQVFLEPEGLDDDLIYPNGISTSLPLEIQQRVITSIPGLQRAVIARPGYAIEYDFVNPQNLTPSLEVRSVKRLFLAGQINGTTGYEEAAAQGLMAGLNAARRASGALPDQVLSRAEAYIGVLVDDLVLHGVSEPYRMLTARAEHRLTLRADNAGLRLTDVGVSWGCVGPERQRRHTAFATDVERALDRAKQEGATSAKLLSAGIAVRQDGQRRTVLDVLGMPSVTLLQASVVFPWLAQLSSLVATQIEAEALYAPYLQRQMAERRVIEREEQLAVPDDTNFANVPGLSREMQQRLERAQPATLGSAGRVPGVTPAAIAALAVHLRRAATS